MDRLKAGSRGGEAREVTSDWIAQRVERGTIFDAVAKHLWSGRKELRGKPRYGDEVPNLAMWLVWERCGLSQTEIGKLFGGLPAGSVAQRLRRISPEVREKAEQIAAEMSNV